LVSPDLLRRLKDMTLGPWHASEEAVLIRGRYRGQVKGRLVHFQAQFDLESLTDRSRVLLPLVGVDLEEGAFLDGAPIHPVPLPQGGGYTLPVRGKGTHRLSVAFSTRVTSAPDFQDLQFGLPPLAQNYLHLTVPATWKNMHVLHSQGEDRVAAAAGQQDLHV